MNFILISADQKNSTTISACRPSLEFSREPLKSADSSARRSQWRSPTLYCRSDHGTSRHAPTVSSPWLPTPTRTPHYSTPDLPHSSVCQPFSVHV